MTPSLPDADPTAVTPSATDIEVTPELEGRRLDAALVVALPGQSRTRLTQAIRSGRVLVDGKPAKPSLLLEAGMRVHIERENQPRAADRAEPESAPPLRIVYEDDQMLVVDKQAGVVVHPAPGHASGASARKSPSCARRCPGAKVLLCRNGPSWAPWPRHLGRCDGVVAA